MHTKMFHLYYIRTYVSTYRQFLCYYLRVIIKIHDNRETITEHYCRNASIPVYVSIPGIISIEIISSKTIIIFCTSATHEPKRHIPGFNHDIFV